MSFDFSTLVTDRTQADVNRVKQIAEKIKNGTASESELAEFNSAAMKGAYNHTDLNRVTAAMEALKAKLEGYGYVVPGYQRIKVPHVLPEPEPTSKLPEGYTELAYIESTGTQYIDTGFKPNQSTKVVMDLEFTGQHSSHPFAFGARDSTGKADFYAYINGGGTLTAPWAFVCGSILNQHTKTGEGRQAVSFGNDGMIVNGVSASVTAVTFQSTVNLWLFCANRNGATQYLSSLKLYSCQIYDNGTMVRDYIPCINPDGAVGLYDLVTAAFFGNSGTGSFVAGAIPRELPEGYTQVEYIEATGTQYIDTKFSPNQDTRVVCKAQYTDVSVNGCLFGSRYSTTKNRFEFLVATPNFFSAYNTDGGLSKTATTDLMVIDKNKNTTTINGATFSTHTYAAFQSPCNLLLFSDHTNGTPNLQAKAKIYYFQIYDNGTLVRDYVPCKNASGVFGLYDLANDVFYQNAGSGTFAAGEEIVAPATASVMVASANVGDYDPYTWYEFDWPTPETMTVYLLNVSAIRAVLAVLRSTPEVPTYMERLMTRDANDIEAILLDVYRQLTIMPTTFIPCGEALCGGDNL